MKFLFDLVGVFFDWDPNYFFNDIFEKDDERKYEFVNFILDKIYKKQLLIVQR